MAAGECMSLVVYAEQYGVQSEKKACNVCYNGKKESNYRLNIGLI